MPHDGASARDHFRAILEVDDSVVWRGVGAIDSISETENRTTTTRQPIGTKGEYRRTYTQSYNVTFRAADQDFVLDDVMAAVRAKEDADLFPDIKLTIVRYIPAVRAERASVYSGCSITAKSLGTNGTSAAMHDLTVVADKKETIG